MRILPALNLKSNQSVVKEEYLIIRDKTLQTVKECKQTVSKHGEVWTEHPNIYNPSGYIITLYCQQSAWQGFQWLKCVKSIYSFENLIVELLPSRLQLHNERDDRREQVANATFLPWR
jgi:hypothetical protein